MHEYTPPLIPPGTEFPVRFAWEGDDINIVYRSLAPAAMAVIRADAGSLDYAPRLLLATLVSWDIEGDDGHPHPITAETLDTLPMIFLSAMLAAMNDDFSKRLAEARKGGGFHA